MRMVLLLLSAFACLSAVVAAPGAVAVTDWQARSEDGATDPVTPENWQLWREAHPGRAVFTGTVTLPERWTGRRVHADWQGAPEGWQLIVNGRAVRPGDFRFYYLWEANQQIEIDLTDYLNPGENRLEIRADAPEAGPIPHLFLADPEVPIGLSDPLPIAGENVLVTVYSPERDASVAITGPDGRSERIALDAEGRGLWRPTTYGKYAMTSGKATGTFQVTAQRLVFHWYNDTAFARNVTHVIVCRPVRLPSWVKRGVTPLKWIGGEFYQREEMGSMLRPEEWIGQ